jgi:hypothetical protein
MGGYTFGDTSLAARRLALLADVFEPPSRAFLAEFTRVAGDQLDLAVDLGCGPGHSTRLVASWERGGPSGSTSRGRSWPWPPPGRLPGSSSPSTT